MHHSCCKGTSDTLHVANEFVVARVVKRQQFEETLPGTTLLGIVDLLCKSPLCRWHTQQQQPTAVITLASLEQTDTKMKKPFVLLLLSPHLLYFDQSTVDGEETLPELELVCERVGVRERDQRHFFFGRAHLLRVSPGTTGLCGYFRKSARKNAEGVILKRHHDSAALRYV